MRNRILHPVLRQIEAIVATEFETIEKQSATAKSNLDYLAISWMAKLLIRFDKHIPLRLARLFSALVQNSLSSTEDGLAHLQITSLKALFNSAQILLASGALDRGSFKKNIDRLLLTLENSNWMSSLPLVPMLYTVSRG